MPKFLKNISFYFALVILAIFIVLGILQPTTMDPTFIDISSVGAKEPGFNGHILGTDHLGKDVFSGLISGTRISLVVATLTLVIALFLAYFFAISTTYFGNDRIQWSAVEIILNLLWMLVSWFILFISFSWWWGSGPKIILWIITILIVFYLNSSLFSSNKKILSIPLDSIGVKSYELFNALPKLIFLIVLLGLNTDNSITWMSLVIGMMLWSGFYRHIRLEIIQAKSDQRFTSLENTGMGDVRIIFFHIIPKSFKSIESPLIFTFGTVILLEAALTFLGMGLGSSYVSWGSILAQSRNNLSAWWLAIYPITCIFLVIFSIHIIARHSEQDDRR